MIQTHYMSPGIDYITHNPRYSLIRRTPLGSPYFSTGSYRFGSCTLGVYDSHERGLTLLKRGEQEEKW